MRTNMFYGTTPVIFQTAEELRARMTEAEKILWDAIHINKWRLKFRRQHPIDSYIVDFYCHSVKLAIELDGGYHDNEFTKKHDAAREKNISNLGITILRFKNHEVVNNIALVLQKIGTIIDQLKNTAATAVESPNNSPSGDGGKLTSSVIVHEDNKGESPKISPDGTSRSFVEGTGGPLFIIKIGGNVIDDETKLSSFLQSFASIKGKKILIHGGGKIATKIGDKLGIESKYVDGRRITDAETIDLVTMVYAGLINKKIVAQLQSLHCNAIGLTGADANIIPAVKRPVKDIDYGFVGDIVSGQLQSHNCQLLLEQNISIVFAPITHDGKGQLLNTNADTIAQEIAKAMSKSYEVNLIYSFEKAGVLLDANDDSTVIPAISQSSYKQLKAANKIFAGMIPKLDNAFAAVDSGVRKVIIGKAEQLQELINGTTGTTIIND